MFLTIEQALNVYREELRKYADLTDGITEKYGEEKLAARGGPFAVCDDQDYRQLEHWMARVEGMVAVLGLSEAEADEISQQVLRERASQAAGHCTELPQGEVVI